MEHSGDPRCLLCGGRLTEKKKRISQVVSWLVILVALPLFATPLTAIVALGMIVWAVNRSFRMIAFWECADCGSTMTKHGLRQ